MKKTILTLITISFISLTGFSHKTTSQNQFKQEEMSKYKWTRESPYSVKETADRLMAVLKHYPTVAFIARINQQENAKSQGVDIDDMETLLFQNNALVGAIFKSNPEAAFELPIKATIWKDAKGKVQIRVTDIDRLDKEYGLKGAFGAIQIIYDLLPPWLDILVSDTPEDKLADVLPKVNNSPKVKD